MITKWKTIQKSQMIFGLISESFLISRCFDDDFFWSEHQKSLLPNGSLLLNVPLPPTHLDTCHRFLISTFSLGMKWQGLCGDTFEFLIFFLFTFYISKIKFFLHSEQFWKNLKFRFIFYFVYFKHHKDSRTYPALLDNHLAAGVVVSTFSLAIFLFIFYILMSRGKLCTARGFRKVKSHSREIWNR